MPILIDLVKKVIDSSGPRSSSRYMQFEDGAPVSYAEFYEKVNQLSCLLAAQGIRKGDVVPVCVERSLYHPLILLALSQIGAIYAPVSPQSAKLFEDDMASGYLSDLVDSIKEDKRTSPVRHCLLSTKTHQKVASYFSKESVKCINIERQPLALYPGTDFTPKERVTDKDRLYLASSSGRTGKRKYMFLNGLGVADWSKRLSKIVKPGHEVKAVAAVVSTDFDAHIWEYLMAWTFGARLHIASEGTRLKTPQLVSFLFNHKISDLTITPVKLKEFTEEHFQKLDGTFNAFWSVGAAFPVSVLKNKRETIYFINGYGASEHTFGLCAQPIYPNLIYKGMAPIDLTKLGDGVSYFLADKAGNEIKVVQGKESKGELYVQTPYLTSGYVGERDQLPLVQCGSKSGLWHKTGDLFLQAPSGVSYFMGPASPKAHLKIHGKHIEPMAVERTIQNLSEVSDSCVTVQGNRLVAFIVLTAMKQMSLQLRRKLRTQVLQQCLSSAAVPSLLKILTSMPTISASGTKKDRARLQQQTIVLERVGMPEYKAPQSHSEKKMIALWSKVFRDIIPDVAGSSTFKLGMDDEFLLLGGDSSRAGRLMVLLESEIKAEMPISMLNNLLSEKQRVTPAKMLNGLLGSQERRKVKAYCLSTLNPGQAVKSSGSMFFIHDITGTVLCYNELVNKLPKDVQTLYTLRAPRNLAMHFKGIDELADFYLDIILEKLGPRELVNLCGWSAGGTIAIAIAMKALERGRELGNVHIIDQADPACFHRLPAPNFMLKINQLLQRLLHHSSILSFMKLPFQSFNQTRFFSESNEQVLVELKRWLARDEIHQRLKQTAEFSTIDCMVWFLESLLKFNPSSSEIQSLKQQSVLIHYSSDTLEKHQKLHKELSREGKGRARASLSLGWYDGVFRSWVSGTEMYESTDHFSILRSKRLFSNVAKRMSENGQVNFYRDLAAMMQKTNSSGESHDIRFEFGRLNVNVLRRDGLSTRQEVKSFSPGPKNKGHSCAPQASMRGYRNLFQYRDPSKCSEVFDSLKEEYATPPSSLSSTSSLSDDEDSPTSSLDISPKRKGSPSSSSQSSPNKRPKRESTSGNEEIPQQTQAFSTL